MSGPAKFPVYPEDTEDVILTRWEKLKNWFDIFKAALTIKNVLLGLLFSSAGAVVVGEATDTKPVRDVAESVGIVQPDTRIASILVRFDEQDQEIEQLKAALERLQEQGIQGPMGPRGKTGPQGSAGKDGVNASPEIIEEIMNKLLPKDHSALH